MTDSPKADARQLLAETLAEANAQRASYGKNPETPLEPLDGQQTIDDGEPNPKAPDGGDIDPEILYYCAGLDHSDTDNGERLKQHFGADLLVITQEKARAPLYTVWTGTHWDVANGGPKAHALAQKLGGRIALEAGFIKPTKAEQAAIDAAKDIFEKDEAELETAERRIADKAHKALAAHAARVKRRMTHAVSSKNSGRLTAMLTCLAPHIMRSPDDFNADDYRLATANATLRFERRITRIINPDYRGASETPALAPEIEKCTATRLAVTPGHLREHLITHVVPVVYDAAATCPAWLRFFDQMMRDPAVRRLVQVSSGLGLIGVSVQKLFFHYGNGANGKSVYMEVLCRVLGESAVTLPATSFIGEGGAAGGASPDLARLYGRRLLRVKELPEGEDLKENLVKEVTGGETVAARDLFSGYMEFKPHFTALMSGNGYPKIQGIDEGIWRRMAVVPWDITIAKNHRREFEEMVESFRPEFPGILNWLIEGVHIFLKEGLVIPDAVDQATQDYRDDMDRTAGFVTRCIIRNPNAEPVQAKNLYAAYQADTIEQGGRPMNNTAFGRAMAKKFLKNAGGRVVLYHGIELVPTVPSAASGPPSYHNNASFEPWPENDR